MKKVIFILCLLFILNNNNLIHAEEWIVNEESEIIINKNYQEIVTFPEYENILLGIMDNISLDGVDVILNRKLLEE